MCERAPVALACCLMANLSVREWSANILLTTKTTLLTLEVYLMLASGSWADIFLFIKLRYLYYQAT